MQTAAKKKQYLYKSTQSMHVRYLLGFIALVCLTNHLASAQVRKTAASKESVGNTARAKSESQVPKTENSKQANPKTPPSPQKAETVKTKSAEPVRINSSPDYSTKSTKPIEETASPVKKENKEAQQIEVKETRDVPNPVVNDDQAPEVTVQASKTTTKPSNILVMLPMPFYSHTQNFMPIFKELARRGHHLTVVSPFPQNLSLPNWEEITVPNKLKELMALMPDPDFSKQTRFFDKIIGFFTFAENAMNLALEMKPLIDLYNDESRQFDLVFVEAQFVQEPLLAFGHKFKAPVIALYPTFINPEVAYYTGNPIMTTTYVPNMFFPFSNSMLFEERATNTAFNLVKLLLYNFWTLPTMDKLMNQYLPSIDLPYIGDLLFNISFTFIDSHHILSYPYPRVNNIREFLGINAKPTSALSQELQEYMDSSEDGVLFFTLGSHFQTSTLRPHILEALIEAFAKLPNKILMKWDKDEPPAGLPPNVKTQKWFPQSAVLAHKNCIGFITHTGIHGLVESLEHAVPVISVPLFADQHFFAKWVREKGVGLSIDIETVTPNVAYETIKEVITNKKYKEEISKFAKLMKDLPIPTLDEITYWTEYVIRTKGAPLLRSGALNLAWYQRFGLDLLAVAVTIIVILIWITIAILKCLVGMCRRTKSPEKVPINEKKKSKKAKKVE